jgi:isocitrate dehydrogenase kinase/phosphatase
MFTFDEQYKKFEEVTERTKQIYEFWYNCVVTTLKDFYKTGK